MNNKIIRNIGIVATIIGAIITGYGLYNFNDAQKMIRTVIGGYELFGTDSTKTLDIWKGKSNNFKLILIVGAIILVIGIILLISGLISRGKVEQIQNATAHGNLEYQANNSDKRDVQDRLNKLEELKEKQIITEDEYLEKRKDILSSL